MSIGSIPTPSGGIMGIDEEWILAFFKVAILLKHQHTEYMKIHMIAFVLLIVGGLNWLLVGLFGWDIGAFLPGGMSGTLAKIVYTLVGLSAIYEVTTHKSNCKECAAM